MACCKKKKEADFQEKGRRSTLPSILKKAKSNTFEECVDEEMVIF